MNRPIRKVATACFALILVLLVNANYRQVVKASDYRDDPTNRRVLERTFERERGSLVLDDAVHTVVAQSVKQVDARFEYLRTYPAGPLWAPVSGFYSFLYGASALEQTEDQVLSGEDDRLFTARVSDALTGREPRGGDVVLTLNAAAQQAAATGLAGKKGAVVALDPKTGAILALASAPTYDPNTISTFDGTAARAAYNALSADAGKPLLNRALGQSYPPGSTFKVVTSAAALADGRTPDTLVASPRQLVLPQTSNPLTNFGGESCGADRISLAQALRISCNTAFAQLALDVGQQKLLAAAQSFGFNDSGLRVPLRVAASGFPQEQDLPSLGQSGIGQRDVQATPLQMAMVAAGVANGGTIMKPYLVKKVEAPDLSVFDQARPTTYRTAVSPDVAAQLKAMMELVVQSGSGTSAKINGVAVAGKTGTAQNAVGAAPHAWFISFAPADDPKVAVAVLVENGGDLGSEATGGRIAAPIAKAVMQAVLGSS